MKNYRYKKAQGLNKRFEKNAKFDVCEAKVIGSHNHTFQIETLFKILSKKYKKSRKFSLLNATEVNYHLSVFIKRYYNLREFFIALALSSPDYCLNQKKKPVRFKKLEVWCNNNKNLCNFEAKQYFN